MPLPKERCLFYLGVFVIGIIAFEVLGENAIGTLVAVGTVIVVFFYPYIKYYLKAIDKSEAMKVIIEGIKQKSKLKRGSVKNDWAIIKDLPTEGQLEYLKETYPLDFEKVEQNPEIGIAINGGQSYYYNDTGKGITMGGEMSSFVVLKLISADKEENN